MQQDNTVIMEESLTESERLAQYGIRDRFPKPTTDRAIIGKIKTFTRLGKEECAFLILSSAATIATIALTVDRMIEYRNNDDMSSDFTFSILLLINAGFCLLYIYSGVLQERQFELFAFIAAYIMVLLYCIFEYAYNVERRNIIKLCRLIGGSILALPSITLALLVARQFGWLEFRIVGASESLQYVYRQTCIFSSLLKFDVQAAISFLVLVLRGDAQMDVVETVTLAVGVPLSLLWSVLGWVAMRSESRCLTRAFIVISFIEPAYVVYRISVDYLNMYQPDHSKSLATIVPSDLVLYSELTAGALAFIVRAITLFELTLVYQNYGMGLRERAFPSLTEKSALLADKPRRLL